VGQLRLQIRGKLRRLSSEYRVVCMLQLPDKLLHLGVDGSRHNELSFFARGLNGPRLQRCEETTQTTSRSGLLMKDVPQLIRCACCCN
jgi:hypothetical protein